MARGRTNPFWDELDEMSSSSIEEIKSEISRTFIENHSKFKEQHSAPEYWMWQFLRRNPSFQKVWYETKGENFTTFYEKFLALELSIGFQPQENDKSREVHWAEALSPMRHYYPELYCERIKPYVLYPEFITLMESSWGEEPSSWVKHKLFRRFFRGRSPVVRELAELLELDDGKRIADEHEKVAEDNFSSILRPMLTGVAREEHLDTDDYCFVMNFSEPDLEQRLIEAAAEVKKVKEALGMPSSKFRKPELDTYYQNMLIYDALINEKSPAQACELADYFVNPGDEKSKIEQKLGRKGKNYCFMDFLKAPALVKEKLSRPSASRALSFFAN